MAEINELNKLFYINVGASGSFKPSGDSTIDSTPQDVDNIIEHLKTQRQKKIVLYFHGGLKNAKKGMSTAEIISKEVLQQTNSHPICFVWETGLIDTISQNFDTIKKSNFFKRLLLRIIKVAGQKLGIDIKDFQGFAKGVDQLSDHEIELELEKSKPFDNYVVNTGKKAANVVTAEMLDDDDAIDTLLSAEIEAQIEEEVYSDYELQAAANEPKSEAEAKLMDSEKIAPNQNHVGAKGVIELTQLIIAAVKITLRVVKRHIKGRDHGFFPTIVEEILRQYYIADLGTWLWGRMKNKARLMWSENNFEGNEEDWKVGSYFLHKLVEYQNEVGELTIDVVGHSAGSIVINEMANSITSRNLNLKFRHVIFLAPALRCDEFQRTLLNKPYLFKDFRCFTMADKFETQDSMIPYLYTRSLLYFISGVLENDSKIKDDRSDAHILGLERHVTGNTPYDRIDYLKDIKTFLEPKGKIVYAVTEDGVEDGFRCTAKGHTFFDDEQPTLHSVMFIINQ